MVDALVGITTIAAGILAGVVSVTALTRGARLKRTAQTLRDAAGGTDDPRQKAILLSLHQSTVAHIVASQLVPWWRLWAPVATIAFLAAVAGRTGWSAAQYIATEPDFELRSFATAASFSGDPWGLVASALVPLSVAYLWAGFEWTVRKRGQFAADYVTATVGLKRLRAAARYEEYKTAPELAGGAFMRGLAVGAGGIYGSAAAGVVGAGFASRRAQLPFVPTGGLELVAFGVFIVGYGIAWFAAVVTLDEVPRPPVNHPSGTYTLPHPAPPSTPTPTDPPAAALTEAPLTMTPLAEPAPRPHISGPPEDL